MNPLFNVVNPPHSEVFVQQRHCDAVKWSHEKTHSLSPAEQEALSLLKAKIHTPFPGAQLVLYGSRARGSHEADSDIDILALLDSEITSDIHERISRCAYDIELEYDIVISILLESLTFWNSHKASLMPIHQVIEEEGVAV